MIAISAASTFATLRFHPKTVANNPSTAMSTNTPLPPTTQNLPYRQTGDSLSAIAVIE
jgi:hypothetical protein